MAEESKYVVFRVGQEHFALDIRFVERILTKQDTTRIPRSPKAMLGIFELRGSTIPVFDLAERMSFKSTSEGINDIVVAHEEHRYALRVDSVDGIVSLSGDQVEEAPALAQTSNDPFVAGVGKNGDQLLVLLDPSNLLTPQLEKAERKLAAA
jgi:purine-binding chemotaxis protein CheW